MAQLLTKTRYFILAGIVMVWVWMVPKIVQPALSKPPAPNIAIQYQYYSISGSTASQLRQQMNQRGPSGPDGRRFDGYTRWNVRWVYQYNSQPDRCKIASANVNLTVNFMMPQWQAPPEVSPSLKTTWQRFVKALQTHENGHRDHGIGAANVILKTLNTLPAKASCKLLETEANAKAMRIIADYSRKDVEYDRLTRHGATQGVKFP